MLVVVFSAERGVHLLAGVLVENAGEIVRRGFERESSAEENIPSVILHGIAAVGGRDPVDGVGGADAVGEGSVHCHRHDEVGGWWWKGGKVKWSFEV